MPRKKPKQEVTPGVRLATALLFLPMAIYAAITAGLGVGTGVLIVLMAAGYLAYAATSYANARSSAAPNEARRPEDRVWTGPNAALELHSVPTKQREHVVDVIQEASEITAVDVRRMLDGLSDGKKITFHDLPQDGAEFLQGRLTALGADARVVVKAQYRREGIPERVRHEVWRRDQGRCVVCGSQERLEFDHIIPISKGGSNTARNIELRCEYHNREKGAKI